MLLERAPATRVETESTGRIDPAALIEEARTRQRRRRARWWAAFVTGAALCALAYGIDRATSGTAGSGICDTAACSGTAATKPSDGFDRPVYGFSRIYAAQSVLSRFDLTTLRQTGRRLLVPRDLEPEGISPDGRYAVLVGARAAHAKHAAHALSLVALPALRIDTAIQSRLDSALAGQYVAAARWLGPHRLVVVAARAPRLRGTFVDTTMRVVAIDPDAGTVEWSRPLGSRPPAIEAAVVERRLVLVFEAAPGALRRVAVLVVSPSGRAAGLHRRPARGGGRSCVRPRGTGARRRDRPARRPDHAPPDRNTEGRSDRVAAVPVPEGGGGRVEPRCIELLPEPGRP
jgi:hypothetical protein